MPTKEELKRKVCEQIDQDADSISGLGEDIMDHPELGFKEVRTAQRVAELFGEMDLPWDDGLAITGVKAVLRGKGPGPTVAIMGELDALVVPDHPRADSATGAAHACGHNAQIAGMLGAAMGLVRSNAAEHLSGNVVFFAVPAEEYVEIDYRLGLVKEGKTSFIQGKPELVQLGHFDDVDMAVMIHSSSPDQAEGSMGIAESNNGFLAKNIRFVGTAAHAGARPELGVNALNAATLALNAIHAQREAFRDEDCVRVHPIITKGGDLVNIVPADVRMETYVRAKSHEAVMSASARVDRALRGAAMALGCTVEIETIPGSLPLLSNQGLAAIFKENASALFGPAEYRDYPHSGGSTDAGDLSQIMPVLHPYMTGARGGNHSPQWHIGDFDSGYIAPAKTLAMMAIDLLGDGGESAEDIRAEERPAMSPSEYLQVQKKIFHSETFDGAGDFPNAN